MKLPTLRNALLKHALGSLSPPDVVHAFYAPGAYDQFKTASSRLAFLNVLWGVLKKRSDRCVAWQVFIHSLRGHAQVSGIIPRSRQECREMLECIELFPEGYLKTYHGALDGMASLKARLRIYENMLSATNNRDA